MKFLDSGIREEDSNEEKKRKIEEIGEKMVILKIVDQKIPFIGKIDLGKELDLEEDIYLRNKEFIYGSVYAFEYNSLVNLYIIED